MLLMAMLAAGAPPGAAAAAAPAAEATRTPEQRDVVILLEDNVLHVRLKVGLGGVALSTAREDYVDRLLARLDANKDGKLSRDEAAKSPLLRTKSRPGASQFLEGLKGQAQLTKRDIAQTVERLGGELMAYRQDLTSSQNDTEVFKLLDANGSGALEADEIAAASDLILSKDEDGDECVSFQEFFPPPPAPDPMLVSVDPAATTPTPVATVADMVRDASEPLLPRRLLKKYDKNRDLHLSATELGWSAARLAKIDADGNAKLDVAELANIASAEPDIEMAVDLKAKDAEGGTIALGGLLGKRLDDSGRPDYAKVAFESAVVTFSLRNVDPIASAVENSLRTFNALDLDANGYISKDETAERIRFERGLFELIDADGDGKIFADEMKQYVEARVEPAATTCRMNVYDTGSGFFMALDANADGRVSLREMRRAKQSLAQLERNGEPGIGLKEPVRHFHVEFVRGSYQLFGPSEQLVAMTPAFQQRRPTGPIWFQRMDRNNDGDLTWNEFLGPREVFHQLDIDLDSLLDPQEAAKAQ
jgi:Ca2+-binding EF-hand superfamily protein